MMFVDGENLAIRGRAVADAFGFTLDEGPFFRRNVFLWLPNVKGRANLTDAAAGSVKLQTAAIRAFYYTSVSGSDEVIQGVRRSLRDLDFDPVVFRRPSDPHRKAKGVDISLTKDMLSNAFMSNYDVAFLIAGDGDYVPLVHEVKRLGKVVFVGFFDHPAAGLNEELKIVSDNFFEMWPFMRDQWNRLRSTTTDGGQPQAGQNPAETP
jgi:uncharacterized LabA/DUF88 family protein